MVAEPDVSRVARTIGDPTRLRMLTLLMEGRALTAKELAYGTGVEPSTATSHLRRLLADALVVARAQGRHKYFQLASPQVARCIESLLVLAPATDTAPGKADHPLREARFCYDHLAGRLAVRLTTSLLGCGILELHDGNFLPTKNGERWFGRFGIDLGELARTRRKFAPACMDWSERKDHIGGALGAALAQRLQDARWIKRKTGSREVAITPAGQEALAAQFGIAPSKRD
ncbi:MAG TPA: winged helix-turn-helix domain-containing protein [Candidatus Didemnitutus sp.]|nr:winged helix-turn-helix domain-containing protein [Candidatus Didemnitutus sp.]